jgi:hypothetical protein
MAVSLAQTSESTHHIIISVAIDIPHVDPLTSFDYEFRDRVIELNMLFIQIEEVASFGGDSEGSF